MAKLVLSKPEIALIKSFTEADGYNDQMVQAIFSHLGRTINHREVGVIRRGGLKYANVDAASKDERERFLNEYRRALIPLKRCGAMFAEEHFEFIRQSREAMLAAISVFNNPSITFKTEIFITNAVIAWTYLMHAHYLAEDVRYHYDEVTPGGQHKLYELGKCLRLAECTVDKLTVSNLEYLLELRHEIEHRMAEGIDMAVSAKIQACAVNFDNYIAKFFGEEYRINSALPFSIQLSAITLDQRKVMKARGALPTVIEALNKAFEERLTVEELNDPRFVYRVYLMPRTANRPAGADEAIEFVHPKSDKGQELQMALKEVEKTKLLPGTVVKQMRQEGYRWFSQPLSDTVRAGDESEGPEEVHGHHPRKSMVLVRKRYAFGEGILRKTRQEAGPAAMSFTATQRALPEP